MGGRWSWEHQEAVALRLCTGPGKTVRGGEGTEARKVPSSEVFESRPAGASGTWAGREGVKEE